MSVFEKGKWNDSNKLGDNVGYYRGYVELYIKYSQNHKPVSENYFKASYFGRTNRKSILFWQEKGQTSYFYLRKDRSCADNAFIATQITEKLCAFNKEMHITFITYDLKRPFIEYKKCTVANIG